MHRVATSVSSVCVAVLWALTTCAAADGTHAASGSEQDALIMIRLVNAAEHGSLIVHGKYSSFHDLVESGQLAQTAAGTPETLRLYHSLNLVSGTEVTQEFVLGMAVLSEGKGYRISVIDTHDRCGFSLFSDESGVVYEGKTSECGSAGTTDVSGKESPDVNRAAPPKVDPTCPLSELLQGTAKNAQELVDNLQQFTARERIEEVEKQRSGKERRRSDSVFDYVAQINAVAGTPTIDEYRTTVRPENSQAWLFDTGTAAFALLFHPKYISDFAVNCAGRTELQSRASWLLNFSQQPSHGNMFHVYRVGKSTYPVKLKGRAWVSADNFEVMRVETDLIEPIDQIQLQKEHSSVEYAPVEFSKRNVRLWLPQLAELDIDLHGHHYERCHTFTHFQLFSIDTGQQIKQPQVATQ